MSHLFSKLSIKEAQRYTDELEMAAEAHICWLGKINSTLLFHLPPDSRDLASEPHRHCRFGRWYDSVENPTVRALPAFRALDGAHRALHASARRLLIQNAHGEPISQSDHREMMESSLRLRELTTGMRSDFRRYFCKAFERASR